MFHQKNLYDVNFDFALIDNQRELENFLALIKDGDIIAIDTEFTRRDTYFAILSIIQIALKKTNHKNGSNDKIIVVIDALANLDLNGVFAIINNPKITKIIHSSIQDLQIFQHISNQSPQNIVDTQIMANFCQENTNIGYANLVKKNFGIDICKKMQISDWQIRPLKSKQIDYAIIDVIFLHEIYEDFYRQLKLQQRYQWFCEEMLNFIAKSLQDNSPNLLKSISLRTKNYSKNPKQIAQLQNLILLREKHAKIYNLPRERLLKNQELIKITEEGDNYDFRKLHHYQNFVVDIKNLLARNEVFVEKKDLLLTQTCKNNINKIKSIIAENAKKYHINEQFLLSANKVKEIVISKKIDIVLNDWRKKILADDINKILK